MGRDQITSGHSTRMWRHILTRGVNLRSCPFVIVSLRTHVDHFFEECFLKSAEAHYLSAIYFFQPPCCNLYGPVILSGCFEFTACMSIHVFTLSFSSLLSSGIIMRFFRCCHCSDVPQDDSALGWTQNNRRVKKQLKWDYTYLLHSLCIHTRFLTLYSTFSERWDQ